VPRKKKKPEGELSDTMIAALKMRRDITWLDGPDDSYLPPPAAAHGEPWAIMWRQNSGLAIVGRGSAKRAIKLGPAGLPDICGIAWPSGRSGEFEIKLPSHTSQLNANQKRMIPLLRAVGAFVAVVRSLPDLNAAVDAWLRGEREP
jgi:hypothetical protein